jgi:integrase
MNGFVEKRANGRYYTRWRDPVGKLHAKSFAREREAKAYLREVQAGMKRGSYIDESQGKITFEEYAEHYFALAQRRLARTSYARDVSYLNTHVLPQWGRFPLGRITKVAVERWIVDLGAQGGDDRRALAPGTVEKIYQTFRKVLVAAVSDERIPRLPCPDHPPIARAKRKVVRFLTSAELHRLAGSVAERYQATILVAGYGGFRLGELVALRINDVDWDAGTIRVDEALTDVDGHLAFEDPKTARGFRAVPMADLALDRLRSHIEQRVGWADPRALLFTAPNGATLRPNNWRRRHFDPAVSKVGLSPLTPHDLRHTAASFFIAEGANPWMLAEILGHGDTRMIDRVYGHLFEKDRQALRVRMSRRAAEAGSGASRPAV